MSIIFTDRFHPDFSTIQYKFDVYLDGIEDTKSVIVEGDFDKSDFVEYDWGYMLLHKPIWNIVDSDIDERTLSNIKKIVFDKATKIFNELNEAECFVLN